MKTEHQNDTTFTFCQRGSVWILRGVSYPPAEVNSEPSQTPRMDFSVRIINIFKLLITFVKVSIADICSGPVYISDLFLSKESCTY